MNFSQIFKDLLVKAKIIPPEPEEPVFKAEVGEGLTPEGKVQAEQKVGQLIETAPPEPTTPVSIAKGIYQQYAEPSETVKKTEEVLGVGKEQVGLPKAVQKVTRPIYDIGTKALVRTFAPILEPLGKDISDIIMTQELAPKVESGEMPVEVLDQLDSLKKTAPQLVGDVAMAVLAAYSPSVFSKSAFALKGKPVISALAGGAARGAGTGTAFGAAQIAASGTTEPTEAMTIMASSIATLGVLGAITSGAIPVAKATFSKIKTFQDSLERDFINMGFTPQEAKLYASQGGYIYNVPVRAAGAGKESPITTPTSKISIKAPSSDVAGRVEPSGLTSKTVASPLPEAQPLKSTQKTLSSQRINFLNEFAIDKKAFNTDFASSKSILSKYYDFVKSSKNDFVNVVEDVASKFKGEYIYREKKPENLKIKMNRRPADYTLGRVTDTHASTIIMPEGRINEAAKMLDENYGAFVENFRDNPTFLGYKAVHADYELPNGLIGEIQLNTKEGLYQKEFAHKIYEKWRKYIETAKGETFDDVLRKVPQKLKAEFIADKDLSNRIYAGKEKVPQEIIDLVDSRLKSPDITKIGEEYMKNVLEPTQLSGLAKKAYNLTKEGGGATLNIRGEVPTERYIYSPSKETEYFVPEAQGSPETILKYLKEHEAEIGYDKYIGTWIDDGKFYHDISVGSNNLNEALLNADKGKQIAIYDRQTKNSIKVKEALGQGAVLQEAQGRDVGGIISKDISGIGERGFAEKPREITPIENYLNSKVSMTAEKQSLPFKEAVYSTFSKVYTAVIDRFNPISEVVKQATKRGGKIPAGENPSLLARRYLGAKGISESKLFWKTTELLPDGNIKITGEGLSKILDPVKNNLDDIRALMVAERELELLARGIREGITPASSRQVINSLKAKPNYPILEKASREIRDYAKKALLDPLREVGAISDVVYEKILRSNEFYVPFERVIEEIETKGVIPDRTDIFKLKSVPVKKIIGSKLKIVDPLETLITNTYKVTNFVEKQRVANMVVNLRQRFPQLKDMITRVEKTGNDVIQVFNNGKREFYKVNSDLAQAVGNMNSADMAMVFKFLSFPAKTLRAGAVLTPEFIGRNPVRDQMTAFVYSRYGYIPFLDLVKGIWEMIGRKETYNRWLASGGDQSMFVSLDRVSSQKTLQEVAGRKKNILSPRTVLTKLKNLGRSPLEPLRTLSSATEKGTRIGAFAKAEKKVSTLEAGFESREITLDFARLGNQTKEVNSMVAFWNAATQGTDRLIRSMKERPLQTSFKALISITLPSISLYLLNRNNPRYKEIPQYQKDLFWIIIPSDDSPIIRIPKPFELGILFGTVPEHILSWIDKNDPEALTSMPSIITSGASPSFVPTIFLPLMENMANYSFFRERPIVSQSIQDLPTEFQANTYTSETAKKIGEMINYSPAKIENLTNGYFGGLGRYALDASDKIMNTFGITNPPPQPEPTLADIPFLKGFVVREPIGASSESVSKFYDIWEESAKQYNRAKQLAEKGDVNGSTEYLSQHKEALFYKGLNKVAKSLAEIRDKEESIMNDQNLTPRQKRSAITALDTIMTEITQQVLLVIGE